MSCEEAQELLFELAVQDFARIPHLGTCDDCAALADRIRVGEEVIAEDISNFAAGGDLELALERAMVPEVVAPHRRWGWAAGAGLALVAGVLLGWGVARQPQVGAASPLASARCGQDIELVAHRGELSAGEIACLERVYASAKPPMKRSIADVMLADSRGKYDWGDWGEWADERLLLGEVPPELHYRLAVYQDRRGPEHAPSVILQASAALDGSDAHRYTLTRLRATAALSVWIAAEEDHAIRPNEESALRLAAARAQTETFAREWYREARATGRETRRPIQLTLVSGLTD